MHHAGVKQHERIWRVASAGVVDGLLGLGNPVVCLTIRSHALIVFQPHAYSLGDAPARATP